jgi:hypothetical protein
LILSNSQILDAISNYNKNIANADVKIPFVALYKIRRNMAELERFSAPLSETLQDISERYESNNDKEKMDKDVREILAVTNEVDIKLISPSVFENVNMTPAFMETIYFMLDENEDTMGGVSADD